MLRWLYVLLASCYFLLVVRRSAFMFVDLPRFVFLFYVVLFDQRLGCFRLWPHCSGSFLITRKGLLVSKKSRKSIVLITRKCVIFNALDSSLDLSPRLFETYCVRWSDFLDSLMFKISCDPQVSRCHARLHFSTPCSKELLYLLLCLGSCCHLDFDVVLVLFGIFKP